MVRRGLVRVVAAGCALASFAVGCGREGGLGSNADPGRTSFEPELYELTWCENWDNPREQHGTLDDPGNIQLWEQPTGEQMQWLVRKIKERFGEEDVDWYVVEPGGDFPLRVRAGHERGTDDPVGTNLATQLASDVPELQRKRIATERSKLDLMEAEHGRGSTLYLALNKKSRGADSWWVHAISIRKDGKVVALGECPGVTRVLLGAPDPRAVVELLREGRFDEAERVLLEAWPVPSTSSTTGRVPVSTTPSLNDVFFKGPPELFVRLTNVRFDVELPEGWRSTPAGLCASSKSGRGSCLDVNRARVDDQGRVRFSSPVLRDEDLELGLYFTRERGPDVVVVRIPVSMVAAAGAAGDTVEIRGLPEKMPTEPGDYSAGVQLAVVDTVAPR